MVSEKRIVMKGEDNIAKSFGNSKSVRKRCSKVSSFYRFSDDTLDKLSTTLNYFPSSDAKRIQDDPFKRKSANPCEIFPRNGFFNK